MTGSAPSTPPGTPGKLDPAVLTAARHITKTLRVIPRSGRDAGDLVLRAQILAELPRALASGLTSRWDPTNPGVQFAELTPGRDQQDLGIMSDFLDLLVGVHRRPGPTGHERAVQLAIVAEEMLGTLGRSRGVAEVLVSRARFIGEQVDGILSRWGLTRYAVAAESGLGQFFVWETSRQLSIAPVATHVVDRDWLRRLPGKELMSVGHITARPASWLGEWRPGLLADLGLLDNEPEHEETARILVNDGWLGSVGDLVRAARTL
jgi:hypothetical protein